MRFLRTLPYEKNWGEDIKKAAFIEFSLLQQEKVGVTKAKSGPVCATIISVKKGDTCEKITEHFEISLGFFNSLNPNLNCDDLFIGQWLCISGSP
ncbi:LysM domain [Dillenia turbinata]|uniref:LysM domain n=1 Tax=Dillenia turbinata TaxID=194707 RepID=A0AAN8YWB1_9MAGN